MRITEVIIDVLPWAPTHGHSADTGCRLEDMTGVMVNKDLWQMRRRVKGFCVICKT